MLNLSDKDLDRLSREAAGEYDPGDIIGPRSWDKMEVRLDRHLGHVTPNPVRGFYRLPFYYAPVVLLIVGASYYFIRNHKAQKEASSGSPPVTLVKPSTGADKPSSSSQNPASTDKSTSTLVLPPATAKQSTAPAAGTGSNHAPTADGSATTAPAAAGNSTSSTAAAAGTSGSHSLTTNNSAIRSSGLSTHHRPTTNGHGRSVASSTKSSAPAGLSTTAGGSTIGPDNTSAGSTTKGSLTTTPSAAASIPARPDHSAASSNIGRPLGRPLNTRELALSTVRGPVPTKRRGSVSDSALRAFTVKATPTLIHRKGGTYVNRSLQIGVLAAPDFSSVNSMSGDKPGSTIGLTADYQFAHRWYIGTGLLLSRKIYAAAPQNYHVPPGYYNNEHIININFIKGSFNMLEVPLNLRYDFSVTGSTLFFASAGLSSYLLTSENCKYYFQEWNLPRQNTKDISYNNQPSYLFSALDLSVGVEMGINNSLSVIVAPYVKVPVRNIGFGQVDLSSVGINFLFEFSPLLSRKR